MEILDIKKLGLILAHHAEIEGMKVENMEREHNDQAYAYTKDDFFYKAKEIRQIVESVEHEKPFTYNEELVQWAERIANKPMSVGELVENTKWLIHNYKK